MKTAVIYCRYSSDSQTEQSIDGQLRVCTEYAKNNDILILDTYIDRAMTGTNDNRPDFQRMIKDSSRKKWDYVLVYKLDRFSRNKYETVIHKKTLRDNGVKVLSAMENIPDTPEGIILESLLEGMNQYYSAELSQKVKRGMNETRRKGNFTGGFLVYGYKVVDKKVVIDESKADTVRYIFEQYAMGVYVKDIIKALTEKGILNKNKPFARNTVYNILRCEKYSGIYRHNDEVFTNIYPQIVDTETFNKVRDKINANRYGKRSVEVVYLLRNKLKCGYCGSTITAECGTAKNGETKRYYKCLGRKHNNGCNKQAIRKDVLENIVLDNVISELSKPQVMNTIVNGLLAEQQRQAQCNTALNLLLKEKRNAENSIDNIMSAIENGGTSNTAMKRLRELESRVETLDKQITIERSKVAVMLTETDIREYYAKALRLEPQMLVNYLVKEIVLFDDKIEIHYNSPITNCPDDMSGFSFCDKYVDMLVCNEYLFNNISIRLVMYV